MTKLRTKKEYTEMSLFIVKQFSRFRKLRNININVTNKKENTLAIFKSGNIDECVDITIFQNIQKAIKEEPGVYSNIATISNNFINYVIGGNSVENNDSLFVFILLHELGHLSHREVYKYKFGIDDKGLQVIKTRSFLKFHNMTNDKKNHKIYKDHYSYDEIYANNFAYKYFPKIWNTLRENKFIK